MTAYTTAVDNKANREGGCFPTACTADAYKLPTYQYGFAPLQAQGLFDRLLDSHRGRKQGRRPH
eukprot:m.59764 g.59764  ORF g.59764 m.59764 type:complete len:64 (+) comp13823_c0_seq5:133-324(+)